MEFVANFTLNNDNFDAEFDVSEGVSFDTLFEINAAGTTWGSIDGDISNQTDLQDALDSKASNERVDGVVSAFDEDIESINNSITELSGNLGELETTVTNNYNELDGRISSDHQEITNINTTLQGYGNIVTHNTSEFATAAQGALANSALQPGDNISELNNNVGYITSASLPTVNNNKITIQRNGTNIGDFTLNQSSDEAINITVPTTATDIGALPSTTTINDLTTAAQQAALNSGATSTNIGQIATNTSDIADEILNRQNADNGLQSQIDALVVSSDVFDVVGTYADLQAYDISTVPVNDIIKVLVDSTHNDAATYYRCTESGGVKSWTYIGAEGAYYTKSEADSKFVEQTTTVNGKALSSDITLTASDVGALPDSTVIPTVNNATLTIQKNGTTVDTFTANSATNTTVNITVPTDTNDLTNGAGYITGINSSDVTTALGYTPYNSTNPDGYITGINSSDVTTALGYTPYDSSNPSGYTSNVGTVTSVNNVSPVSGNVTLSIPTVNDGTITINQGGVQKGTFTVNQSGNTTINLDAGSSIIVDQTYDGTSANPQSGVAIEGELTTNYQTKLVSGTDIKTINSGSLLGSGDISLADTTLSNVASIDANSAVQTALDSKLNTSQITNCLTEIPQRLNIVYNNNNTLTVKAGSVLTIPYGITDQSSSYSVGDTFINANFKIVDTDWDADNSRFFVHVEVQEDIISSAVSSSSVTNSCVTIRLDSNAISVYNAQGNTGSGSTGMTNTGVYYNTSTNKVVYYSSGTAQTTVGSFPIAYVYSNSADTYSIDKIDIVCNGFGYIGSTIWADKDIKGLAPNGRNADGSLKSTEFTTEHVLVTNNSINAASTGNSTFSIGASSVPVQYIYIESDIEPKTSYTSWYNPIENKRYYRDLLTDNWTQAYTVCCGKATWTYANSAMTITSISQPKPFEVAKVSDLDGQWIYDGSGKTIASSVSFATTPEEKTYDLSSWLPDDGNVYEVVFGILAQTASANGASCTFSIKTDLTGGNVVLCRAISRAANYQFCAGAATLPLKSRIITVRQANNTSNGAPTLSGLYGYCYRKVR